MADEMTVDSNGVVIIRAESEGGRQEAQKPILYP